jgi:uncharacterized membrane protein
MTDVFTLDLKNYDMILGIQWLATLKTIVCNYEEMVLNFQFSLISLLIPINWVPRVQRLLQNDIWLGISSI